MDRRFALPNGPEAHEGSMGGQQCGHFLMWRRLFRPLGAAENDVL